MDKFVYLQEKTMETEIWKDIVGYEGLYQVSNLGRVKSLDKKVWGGKSFYFKKGEIKAQILNPDSYYQVYLYKNNIKKTVKVHKLVAMAFLNHIPNGYEIVIDHIDNNSKNNNLNNLQLISHRENCSKDKIGYSSKYPGVRFKDGKWEVQILKNKKRYYLGRFLNEEDAYKAYLDKLNQNE